jgi:hypothetical protein
MMMIMMIMMTAGEGVHTLNNNNVIIIIVIMMTCVGLQLAVRRGLPLAFGGLARRRGLKLYRG